MDNMIIIIDDYGIEQVIIEHGNGQYTSMAKAFYDEQQAQAEHFTPIVSSDADQLQRLASI